MSKFKVGQKVVCINIDYSDFDLFQCYTVEEVYKVIDLGTYEIKLENEDCYWMESRFEDFDEWASHQKAYVSEPLASVALNQQKASAEVELSIDRQQVDTLKMQRDEAVAALRQIMNYYDNLHSFSYSVARSALDSLGML